jgi:hypothetical protein
MIYQARELYPRLVFTTLTGIEDGELEFIGKDADWDRVCEYEDNPCKECMGRGHLEIIGGESVDLVGYKKCDCLED